MKLIEGRYYKDEEGKVRGPVKRWDGGEGCEHPYSDGDSLDDLYREDGSSFYVPRLVSEVSPPNVLTIYLDTEAAQKLIDDAAKVFDEAAGNLLDKIAAKDEELRAAKEAFNILYREKVNLEIQVDVQDRSLNRKNKELNHYRAELSDAEDTIAVKTERVQRAFRLVESANARSARNENVHKKNEALGFEVLRLNERIHEIRYVANKFVADKKRGDIRLRDTRKRLKLEKERANDAEDQLKGFTSGKAMIRNGLIVLGVVLTAFATGAFFF